MEKSLAIIQNLKNPLKSPNKKQTDEIKKDSDNLNMSKLKLTPEDFNISVILGKGAFAKVSLAEYCGKKYALKIIDKKHVEKHGKIHEVHIEKQILTGLSHSHIVKLHSTFQDKRNLYFVLDYCSKRNLSDFMKSFGKMDTEVARYFSAQIVSALEYLRSKGISHRDLKPDNIMVTENYKLKLVRD